MALPKQTRNANQLRFVHFQFNRRQGYVSFPIVEFLHEENDLTQVYLKIHLAVYLSDPKICRCLRKNCSFRVISSRYWVLLPHQDRIREKEDIIWKIYTIIYILSSILLCNYRLTFRNKSNTHQIFVTTLRNKFKVDKTIESFITMSIRCMIKMIYD